MLISKVLRSALASCALIVSLGVLVAQPAVPSIGGVAGAAGARAGVSSVFVGIVPQLRQTGVPLLLPTKFPIAHPFAVLGPTKPGSYVIDLGYVPACNGHACELGHLAAKKAPAPFHAPHGASVRLVKGRTGYFVNFKCGASCGDAFLRFDYSGYRYTFALKAGSEKQLVAWANSALTAGPA